MLADKTQLAVKPAHKNDIPVFAFRFEITAELRSDGKIREIERRGKSQQLAFCYEQHSVKHRKAIPVRHVFLLVLALDNARFFSRDKQLDFSPVRNRNYLRRGIEGFFGKQRVTRVRALVYLFIGTIRKRSPVPSIRL